MGQGLSIASDHAGYALKKALVPYLRRLGYEPVDLGTDSAQSVDYPDFGSRVARRVSRGQDERGILICGSGIGQSIVANKFPGVRAALCTSPEMAELSRRHNDANVLVLAGRFTSPARARAIVRRWMQAPFEGGRHRRRVAKIARLERSLLRRGESAGGRCR